MDGPATVSARDTPAEPCATKPWSARSSPILTASVMGTAYVVLFSPTRDKTIPTTVPS